MNEYYGDNTRWFVGRIINDQDPDERGRFQVRIHGVHSSDVEDRYLPWAETMLPTTEGGVSGIGRIPQMKRSAFVFGFFLDGAQSQNPIILGSMSHVELPSSTQQRGAAEGGRIDLLDPKSVGKEGVLISNQQRQIYQEGAAELRELRVLTMDILISNGLPTVSAAGVCGNIEIESNFNPKAELKNDVEHSLGIAQWNKRWNRWQRLEAYAAELNEDPFDYFLQMKFLIYDMKTGGIHKCWEHLSNVANITNFDGAKDDKNSTWYFFDVFEKADPAKYVYKKRSRPGAARQAFEDYKASLIASAEYNYTSARAG